VQTVISALAARSGHRTFFAHHIGSGEQRRRYCESNRVGSLQVHNQFVFCRSLHWQVRRFLTSEDTIDIVRRAAILVRFIRSKDARPPAVTNDRSKRAIRGSPRPAACRYSSIKLSAIKGALQLAIIAACAGDGSFENAKVLQKGEGMMLRQR